MSEILLRAEDARSAARDVSNAASDLNSQVGNLKARLAPLDASFRGKTAEAWAARFEEWRTSSIQLLDSLDQLGVFLNGAADQIEETDARIAGSLG